MILTGQIVAVHGIYMNIYRELLLVKKEDLWILPGGKLESHETDVECLTREFKEELPLLHITRVGDLFGVFMGITPHSYREIKEIVYWITAKGSITPSKSLKEKIKETQFVSFSKLADTRLSELTNRIVSSLVKGGYFW